MTRSSPLVLTIALVLMLSACAQPQRIEMPASMAISGDDSSLPPDLAKVLREYEAAWTAKDAVALSNLFAANGFVLPSGHPPVRGRESIRRHYQGSGGPLHLRAMAWAEQGDVGYIIGEYAHDPSFANPGKFTLTLARDDADRWLIMSDMDNGNTRPQSSPAN